MPWYPGAVRRPITRNYTARKTAKNAMILHTDAGDSLDLYGWWMNPANTQASSHFHVTKAGRVIQYVDTDYITWASGAANSRSISFETQGIGNEPWTPAQVAALVQVLAWAAKVHGIPLRQMRNSAAAETGIGWHRQGVYGNFPSGLLGGVGQNGGQKWSNAEGKECPGTLRIQQIPGIIAQLNGAPIQHASSNTAAAIGKEWSDMATKEEIQEVLRAESDRLYDRVLAGIKWAKVGYKDETLREMLHSAERGAQAGYSRVVGVAAAQDAVVSAVATAASKGAGLTPEQVQQIAAAAEVGAERGAQAGLAEGVTLEATVKSKEN